MLMNHIGLMYCLLTTVCWASSPVFLRKGLETFDNTEINAVRSIASVAASLLMCLIINPSLILWKYGFGALGSVFVIMMFGNFVGDLCHMVAIHNIGVGRALATSNAYPIFISLFSIYWFDEAPSLKLWIGIIIIITGLALLNCSRKNPAAASGGKSNALGFFMAVLTSVLWAVSLSIQKWALMTYEIEPLTFVLWRAVMLSLTAWGVWYFRKNGMERRHIFDAGFKKWLSPFLAGTFSLAIGGIAFSHAIAIIPISVVSPIAASNPVIAAIIAKFAFNEKLSAVQWAGIIMAIIGGIEVSS